MAGKLNSKWHRFDAADLGFEVQAILERLIELEEEELGYLRNKRETLRALTAQLEVGDGSERGSSSDRSSGRKRGAVVSGAAHKLLPLPVC